MINKKLRNQILAMHADDQDMRMHKKYDPIVDKRNTKRMKKIVEKYGWLSYDLVGYTAARCAWLLVQHSDHDNIFQRKCLELMKLAVKKRQASKEDLAYLTDRVLVNEGKSQLYGTQFYVNREGKYGPIPIKDSKNLNKRRKQMGLEIFKEYRKRMMSMNQPRRR